MNKKNLPTYLGVAVATGILIGAFFASEKNNPVRFASSPKELKVKRLLNYIENEYVDAVDTDSLLDGAIESMLVKLDPHSVYISKEELQAVTENMQGNFVGIGVQFRMENDSIVVIKPIENGPSQKAGIKAGDRILKANEHILHNKKITTDEIMKRLKGKPNSEVTLQVYRKMNDSLFSTKINRKKINIKSVDIAYMLNDSIGYIKLDRFARNTYKEFEYALSTLLLKGMTKLIFDLRGNGGGFIDIAKNISDEFLEKGKLIVFTKNNRGEVRKLFATKKGNFENGNLYVLIDENSASASEIVAGALQDNDKGTIIGRRSFGKGLVQQEMDLGDGSAVRLTTSRYYTPTGRSIQKPYSHSGDLEQYKGDIYKRFKTGELLNRDSIKVADSLKYKTPKGKIVYGGGGIIPDIFVPIDTSYYLPVSYYKKIHNFAFNYVDKNRKQMNLISIDDFLREFDKDTSVTLKFYDENKTDELSYDFKKAVQKYLKLSVARELFSDEGWYRLKHKDDKMIQKVFELEEEQKP